MKRTDKTLLRVAAFLGILSFLIPLLAFVLLFIALWFNGPQS
jgi:hypothetical protein